MSRIPEVHAMKIAATAALAIALGGAAGASAQPGWSTYRISETGTSVDIPVSIFTKTAGKPDGYGQRFRSADGGAALTVQSAPNASGDSPAVFLAKKRPPANIIYKRVTPSFFVVSSIKGDKIWYDRCNFSGRFVHCVLLNYPASEKRQWDGVVTRISHSLSGA
jgi:hypothetical protein